MIARNIILIEAAALMQTRLAYQQAHVIRQGPRRPPRCFKEWWTVSTSRPHPNHGFAFAFGTDHTSTPNNCLSSDAVLLLLLEVDDAVGPPVHTVPQAVSTCATRHAERPPNDCQRATSPSQGIGGGSRRVYEIRASPPRVAFCVVVLIQCLVGVLLASVCGVLLKVFFLV
jgi:hypothetical protein